MGETTRVTITLPTEQVEALKRMTDNVSGWVAEATARQLRAQLLAVEMEQYQEEYGEFTEEELAAAEAAIGGEDAGSGNAGYGHGQTAAA